MVQGFILEIISVTHTFACVCVCVCVCVAQDRVYVERLHHSFPRMPPMRPPRCPTAGPGVSGDLLFENPHAMLIPWRGRIEMDVLDLWKALDASVHTDNRRVGRSTNM